MSTGGRGPIRSVVQFRVLGVVTAEIHGTSAELGDIAQRRALTGLLAALGQFVSRDELMDWVWDIPPADAHTALDALIETVRADRLAPIGLGDALVCGGGIHKLAVPPEWVDLHRFRTLTERAAQLDDVDAREFLAAALHSVRGIPLADLPGRRVAEFRREVAEEIRAAEITFGRIEVERGRGSRMLPRLEQLFRDFPGDAAIAEVYLAALHSSGLSPAMVAARTRSARRARENWADAARTASAR
ncbi:AfsR/SARP family transcriptional regulator [Nocardia takedensis]